MWFCRIGGGFVLMLLLMAATGHTSEEITGLSEQDVEFTADGVELRFTKLRANSVRRIA